MSGQPGGGMGGNQSQFGQPGGGYGSLGSAYYSSNSGPMGGGYGSYGGQQGGQYNPQSQYGGGQSYGGAFESAQYGRMQDYRSGMQQQRPPEIGMAMGNPMVGVSSSLPQDYTPPPMSGGNWMGDGSQPDPGAYGSAMYGGQQPNYSGMAGTMGGANGSLGTASGLYGGDYQTQGPITEHDRMSSYQGQMALAQRPTGGYQNPGMWGGGMPSYGQMGNQSQYVGGWNPGGQQPGQGGQNGFSGDEWAKLRAASDMGGGPQSGQMTFGHWQQQNGGPQGGNRPTISGNGRSQFNAPIGLNTPTEGTRNPWQGGDLKRERPLSAEELASQRAATEQARANMSPTFQTPGGMMWGGGQRPADFYTGNTGNPAMGVGGQGIGGMQPTISGNGRSQFNAPIGLNTPTEGTRNAQLREGMFYREQVPEGTTATGGPDAVAKNPSNYWQPRSPDFYTGNTGNPAMGVGGQGIGGMQPTISGNGRSQFASGGMPPQAPPIGAKSMAVANTPPYVPPQQVQQPAQPSYQDQWQAQLKAAQNQLNMGGAQYQPQEQKAYPEGYQFETTPSTLDPGSMAGLQSWLGGSASPFGSTIAQQNQGYADWYNQTYGRQAPGGPTRY